MFGWQESGECQQVEPNPAPPLHETNPVTLRLATRQGPRQRTSVRRVYPLCKKSTPAAELQITGASLEGVDFSVLQPCEVKLERVPALDASTTGVSTL